MTAIFYTVSEHPQNILKDRKVLAAVLVTQAGSFHDKMWIKGYTLKLIWLSQKFKPYMPLCKNSHGILRHINAFERLGFSST